jgi:cobalt/nickel transport protein
MLPPMLAAVVAPMLAGPAAAHYGMVIPDEPMVSGEDGRSVGLALSFSHPFEREGMTLERPEAFYVVHEGERTDLLGALEPATVMGSPGFTLDHELARPGAHVFAMEPRPYWEPAEDAFIQHFTKAYVAAFGDDAGWDAELGLPTEIVPLAKPFGLWQGNVFQGIVTLGGEAVPFAEVEVEHHSTDAPGQAPSELMVTQTIRADGAGVFTYAAPAPGWWGFAALSTAEHTLEHEGEAKPVELGAVIWVRFEPWGAAS